MASSNRSSTYMFTCMCAKLLEEKRASGHMDKRTAIVRPHFLILFRTYVCIYLIGLAMSYLYNLCKGISIEAKMLTPEHHSICSYIYLGYWIRIRSQIAAITSWLRFNLKQLKNFKCLPIEIESWSGHAKYAYHIFWPFSSCKNLSIDPKKTRP